MADSDVAARLRAAGCVFADEETQLISATAATEDELRQLVTERVAGKPLEYVLGWAEFCGLRIALKQGVFVPRRRTEFLVDVAARRCRQRVRPVVLDLCCGSGAVGAAVWARCEQIELHAADIDPIAVECARSNIAGAGGVVYQSDLYASLPVGLLGRVDLIMANAPYVPTDSIPLLPREARLHEPAHALDGGGDGLDVVRRVVSEAGPWLSGTGAVLVEVSNQQAAAAAAATANSGLVPMTTHSDDLGTTVVTGTKPASASR